MIRGIISQPPQDMRLLISGLLRPARLVLAAAALALLSSGCVYRMTIQQGNFLEERAVEQLQVGMTRSQVRYLLGTPMVPDAFNKDRWDYLYYLKRGRLKSPVQRHLVVYFEDDKVARIERHDPATATARAEGSEPDRRKGPSREQLEELSRAAEATARSGGS